MYRMADAPLRCFDQEVPQVWMDLFVLLRMERK